jgi:alkylation response protein AidB-like acyl-CoA dehydrogenase
MLGGSDGEGTGFGIAMNGLNGGRINIAACSLGGAQTAYHRAAAYVRDREAVGAKLLDETHDPVHPGRHGDRAGVVANDIVAGCNGTRR